MSDRHRHPRYGPKGRKGVYAKARRCEIIGFTGIDNPYEAPENPEITLETVIAKPEQNARRVLEHLEHQSSSISSTRDSFGGRP